VNSACCIDINARFKSDSADTPNLTMTLNKCGHPKEDILVDGYHKEALNLAKLYIRIISGAHSLCFGLEIMAIIRLALTFCASDWRSQHLYFAS
jgi:hypothetical protein